MLLKSIDVLVTTGTTVIRKVPRAEEIVVRRVSRTEERSAGRDAEKGVKRSKEDVNGRKGPKGGRSADRR